VVDQVHSLAGRVAFVTGASSGLGEQMALTLARAGAHVAITARRAERLTALAERIQSFDGRALPIVMDIREPDQVRAAVAAAETELGPIQVLINNAGLAVAKFAQDFTDDDYDLVMDTNVKGAWITAQAVGRRMIEHGHGGKIVNVASLVALKQMSQLSLYGISKAAVAEMTRTLALEWLRYGIQVNAICPGYIETEMNAAHWRSEAGKSLIRRFPARRLMPIEALDALVLLLSSSGSDHMTGAIIPIDEAQSLM
jgi:NAD(P)-dependent dehydrogenase (short-subunit alcohol dehydrogenase family)